MRKEKVSMYHMPGKRRSLGDPIPYIPQVLNPSHIEGKIEMLFTAAILQI